MTPETVAFDPALLDRADDVIDVRSPAEFAEDHAPGAINLPVLDNDERALVGTIYVRESRFRARRIGAALVARNIAAHLEGPLSDRPEAYRPLVYCWRGGMRSGAMATVLTQVGWHTRTLRGGYKAYRAAVMAALYSEDASVPGVVLIDGATGTAKTALLHRLAHAGEQVIDLEGLANHRGSLFGGRADDPQPSQKMFESRLWDRIRRLDPTRPVFVEAESSKIGKRVIPPLLWRSMLSAPRVELSAAPPVRAGWLLEAYEDIIARPGAVEAIVGKLAHYHPRDTITAWKDMASRGAYAELAERLMIEHYDPAYARSRGRHGAVPKATVTLERMDTDSLDQAAETVVRLSQLA